jgi:hypothetical protein
MIVPYSGEKNHAPDQLAAGRRGSPDANRRRFPRRVLPAGLFSVALLFMTSLFANRFGQSFLVDQAGIPSDTAQIAGRSFNRSLEHPVISRMHVNSERDVAIRMGESAMFSEAYENR